MMTFTGFSGGSSGPVPATAGMVARPGAASASPGAGRAFAAIMGAGGAGRPDAPGAPDVPVPDMATGGDGQGADGAVGARGSRARQPGVLPSADDAETAIVPALGDRDAMPSFAAMPQVDAAQRVGTVPPHDAPPADATTRPTAAPTPASHHAQAPPSAPAAIQAPVRLPERGGEGADSGERPQDSGPVALPGQGGAPDVRQAAIPSRRVATVPDGGAAPMGAAADAPGASAAPEAPNTSAAPAQPRPPLAAGPPGASLPALAAAPNRDSPAQAAVAVAAQARATPPPSPARAPGSGEQGAGSTTHTTKDRPAALPEPGTGTAPEVSQIAVAPSRGPVVSDGGGPSHYGGGDRRDAPARSRQPLAAAPPAPAPGPGPGVAPALLPGQAPASQTGAPIEPLFAATPPHPVAPSRPPVAAAPVLIIPAEGRPAPIAALSAPKGRFDAPRTSGPRAAPVFPARAAAPPPPGTPVPTDAATALAAAMRIAVDIAGGADPARAAPEQDVSAPQAHSLAPPAPQDAATQDIPRQIALRIAHAAAGAAGTGRGTVEISLSPEELGRVRLRLHPSEGGLSVTITADRPETLDLMRRNIDLLAREFLEIGYQGTRFDFAQGGPGADADPGAPDLAPAPAPALDTPPPDTGRPSQATLLMLGDRLDIRL